jgi:hypothetical protein
MLYASGENMRIAIIIASIGIAIFFLGYSALLIYYSWPIESFSVLWAAPFGDSFGIFSSLFSGLALIGLLYTIHQQGEELKLQREEMKSQRGEMSKTVATQIRQLHIELLKMAVEHPDLQEVWEEEGLIEKISFKQNTYMNLIVSHWEMQHINGMVPREQVEEMLDTYMQRSYFQKFWANSGKYRDRYAKKAALKEEREFFEMVNSAYKKSIRPAAKESTD